MAAAGDKSIDRKIINVLVVEDDEDFLKLIKNIFMLQKDFGFELHHAAALSEAFDKLRAIDVDIILLDLNLPDSKGIATFSEVNLQFPQIPVVIHSCIQDTALALDAVKQGAQDFILKGTTELKVIPRLLGYALERHRIASEIGNLSLRDGLTQTYNRNGLELLAVEHMKLARRNLKGIYLFLIDLDDLKKINDQYGHLHGDSALFQTAEILRNTFRKSDVIARVGGDEFVVLALEALEESKAVIVERMRKNLHAVNRSNLFDFELNFSVGAAFLSPASGQTLSDLVSLADAELYAEKAAKRKES